MTPIVPWRGGKRRLAKHILPILENQPHRCYVEPFAGSAAILFMRTPAPVEVIPPYWETAGYGTGFDLDQHRALAASMASIEGRMILSINDHPAMRKVYGAFHHRRLKTVYTAGGTHRAKAAAELLVTSW